jgi:nitric oxide reductase activation protein
VALPQAQYTYPEWNYRLAREHPCWSTVLECPPVLGPLDAALRERIAADHPVRAPRRRPLRVTRPAVIRRRHLQDEGDTLDINATIDLRVALSRKLPPDLRVFSAIRPSPQETSVLILLDLSASTDLHAAAQEKRAACQLGERLDDEHHRVAIHGFCSDGRHQVFYHCFKAFDAPFDDACRDRLLRARSSLSTRLGAALRHATTQMLAELPRRAKILLIGDGEPADIDVFDPRYLPADAAHAAHTARRRGIDVLALSFSSGAAISGTAGNAATGEKEGDALQMRSHIYGATTFSAAMERAYAFIGH